MIDNSQVNILYIAGYGRSGSTLLEILLSQHPNIIGLGEFSEFLYVVENKTRLGCSCGKKICDCPFWNPINTKFQEKWTEDIKDLQNIQRNIEGIKKSCLTKPLKANNIHNQKQYAKMMNFLFNLVIEKLHFSVQYLVDSSKTSYSSAKRPSELSKHLNANIKIIHLVRDIRAIIWSMLKRGLNRNLENNKSTKIYFPAIRAIVGWYFANRYALKLKKAFPAENYIQINYEELVLQPEKTLEKLGRFLSIEVDEILRRINDNLVLEDIHLIAGNRMRKKKNIKITPDFEWHEKIPKRYVYLCRFILKKELNKYGYNTDSQN